MCSCENRLRGCSFRWAGILGWILQLVVKNAHCVGEAGGQPLQLLLLKG
jgi:hypothetical protein